MKKTTLIAIGAVCYCAFMFFLTPASWWLKLAPLPSQLQFGAIKGTLFKGEIAQLRYQHLQFSNVSWQLNAWQLITAKLQFHVKSGSVSLQNTPFVDAAVSYGFAGVAVKNAIVKLPVNSLMPFMGLPLPVNAVGELALDISHFSQGGPSCTSLEASATWLDAKLQTPTGTWLDLQNLFGTLQCENGNVVLKTDGANVLGLNINAVLTGAGIKVDGSLKPDAGVPEEVHQAMQFLGKPDNNGRYSIRF